MPTFVRGIDPIAINTDGTNGISADDLRFDVGALLTSASSVTARQGVIPEGTDATTSPAKPTALQVIANTPTGMSIVIKAGRAVVQPAGTTPYIAGTKTAVTLNPSASNPTNKRIDLVVLRIYDDENSIGSTRGCQLEMVTGQAAGSPVAPALPAASLLLATVTVRANTANILASDIVDNRVYTAPSGGIALFGASENATPGYPGQYADFSPGYLGRWNGNSWDIIADSTGWKSWTPTLNSDGGVALAVGAGGSQVWNYRLGNGWAQISGQIQFGTSGVNGGKQGVYWTLPPNIVPSQASSMNCWVATSQGRFYGFASANVGSNKVYSWVPKSVSNCAVAILQNTDASGGSGTGVPAVSGGFPLNTGSVYNVHGFVAL